jgi:hypothetical protein
MCPDELNTQLIQRKTNVISVNIMILTSLNFRARQAGGIVKPLFNRAPPGIDCASLRAFTGTVVGRESTPAARLHKRNTMADRSKLKPLQRPFLSGPARAGACRACRGEGTRPIHRRKHGKWQFLRPDAGRMLRKNTLINNFCTSIAARSERIPVLGDSRGTGRMR